MEVAEEFNKGLEIDIQIVYALLPPRLQGLQMAVSSWPKFSRVDKQQQLIDLDLTIHY